MAGGLSRSGKTRKIGQAHLAPGMSLARLERIYQKYQIKTWYGISDDTIDAIIKEIAAIVQSHRQVKEEPYDQTIRPPLQTRFG